MQEFKDIRQRIMKQLSQLFPSIGNKPDVKRSPSLQPLYKVIPCLPIPPKIFKQAYESIDSQSQLQNMNNLLQVSQVLRKVEQYLTGCINMIEHNEKVRQKYELMIINEQEERVRENKQVNELIRVSGNVRCKSELSQLIKQKGERILQIDNYNERRSFGQEDDKKLIRLQQVGQLYLPLHPDQYQFITVINQDQYLIYHQEVLQKLLIQLTRINKINQQLSMNSSLTLSKSNIKTIRQLLSELMKDQMFCVQDNKYNRLIKFVLQHVHNVVSTKQQYKNQINKTKYQLKHSFLSIYYLQFMSRNQLSIINNHLQNIIQNNNKILLHIQQYRYQQSQLKQQSHSQQLKPKQQINIKKITKQLQDIKQLNKQIQHIFSYLTHKQQQIFNLIYKRKLKKFIITHKHTSYSLHLASKINKTILLFSQSNQSNFIINLNTPRQSQQKSNRNSLNQNITQNIISQQLQIFSNNLLNLQHNIQNFSQSNQQINHLQSFTSLFTKLYRQIQQNQLKLSQINYKISKINTKHKYSQFQNQINTLKLKILNIQTSLIDKFKTKNQNGQLTLFPNLPTKNSTLIQDDKQSVFSSVSSKSSIFQPYHIDESYIILPKPTQVNQSYLPPLAVQQLIKTANDFITNQFLKNPLLNEQLQDVKNLNLDMLNCLIYQLDKNITTSTSINQKQITTESPSKIKPKQSSSPQKNPPKNKISRQKPMQKSPKKAPPKKQTSPSKQQPVKKQQTKTIQILTNIKDKLIFIRQILCPQISQCKISKIFEQTLQTEIFQKICSILTNYKQKIFTQKVYQFANKYGFMKFVQQRVSFINTFIKNQKQLLQIFKFIRVFSQQKIKFQSTDEKTFQVILKALLASKQIQAYRRQNLDLAKSKNLSSSAVKFLDQEIYVPFILMFKNLLKIISSQQSTVKQLQQMLENVKQSIQIKEDIKSFLVKQNNSKLQIQNLINKIQKIIGQIVTLKKYPIFKYSKLQSISKILRSSLSLQVKSQNQDRKQVILNYLKSQLFQIHHEKSQPLLS